MFSKRSLADRFANVLQCLAVADAVGYLYEFDDLEDRPDSSEIVAAMSEANRISDDTQMTLFTAKAVMDILDGQSAKQSFEDAYLQWYKTQNQSAPLPNDTGLNAYPELYHRAAPGLTCMDALRALASGREVRNDSYGCGSVMRLLPIVLLFERYGLETCREIAAISGDVTHKHEMNRVAIHRLIDVYHYVLETGKMPDVGVGGDFSGWDAVSCVDAAIQANKLNTAFEDVVVWCIRNTEDCDSTAAVAASIWGLMHDAPAYKVKEQKVLDETMITFRDYLSEAKNVGVVYHFTTMQNLSHLADKKLQRDDLDADVFTLYARRGASLTRNYALSDNLFGDFSKKNGYVARIAIDGDKLSDKYKIKPVAGFYVNQNDPKAVLNPNHPYQRIDRSDGEAEELVIPKNELVELKNHIFAIDFVSGYTDPTELERMSEKIRNMGFQSSVVRKWTPRRKL